MKTQNQTSKESNNLFLCFNNQEIKYLTVKGNIWFKGKDVAKVLGYKKPEQAIEKNIPIKNKDKKYILYEKAYPLVEGKGEPITPEMKTIYINESGLYRLIMRSKLKNDDIEKFQDWVTEDVLPSIRKTGKYECHKKPKIMSYINEYLNKSVFYVLHVHDNLYKYGITDDIGQRYDQHDNTYENATLFYIEDIKNFTLCNELEKSFSKYLKQIKIKKFYNPETQELSEKQKKGYGREYFVTSSDNTIGEVISKLKDMTADIIRYQNMYANLCMPILCLFSI